jgi:DNA-binding response OmpR family regulator
MRKLLLADDSITIQKVVGIIFAREDYQLVIAEDGDSALAKALVEKPDIVIADISMPGRDGFELCRAIKSEPRLAKTSVVLLPGVFDRFDEVKAKEVCADGWLTKPFESQSLIDKVEQVLTVEPLRLVAGDSQFADAPAGHSAPESTVENLVESVFDLGVDEMEEAPTVSDEQAEDIWDDVFFEEEELLQESVLVAEIEEPASVDFSTLPEETDAILLADPVPGVLPSSEQEPVTAAVEEGADDVFELMGEAAVVAQEPAAVSEEILGLTDGPIFGEELELSAAADEPFVAEVDPAAVSGDVGEVIDLADTAISGEAAEFFAAPEEPIAALDEVSDVIDLPISESVPPAVVEEVDEGNGELEGVAVETAAEDLVFDLSEEYIVDAVEVEPEIAIPAAGSVDDDAYAVPGFVSALDDEAGATEELVRAEEDGDALDGASAFDTFVASMEGDQAKAGDSGSGFYFDAAGESSDGEVAQAEGVVEDDLSIVDGAEGDAITSEPAVETAEGAFNSAENWEAQPEDIVEDDFGIANGAEGDVLTSDLAVEAEDESFLFAENGEAQPEDVVEDDFSIADGIEGDAITSAPTVEAEEGAFHFAKNGEAQSAPVETAAVAAVAAPNVLAETSLERVEQQLRELPEEELQAVVAKVAGPIIERLASEMLEKICWEVVPDLAEAMIQEEIRKIKEGMG